MQKFRALSFPCNQGDQIGRIFARWAIVYFGQFFENCRSSPNFRAAIFSGKNYALILTYNGLVYILGDFFSSKTQLVTLLATIDMYATILRNNHLAPANETRNTVSSSHLCMFSRF
jgi:hypothetical protein